MKQLEQEKKEMQRQLKQEKKEMQRQLEQQKKEMQRQLEQEKKEMQKQLRELRALRESHAALQDTLADRELCVVCMEGGKEVRFDPCGHVACCRACGEGQRACPVCRAAVRSRQRVFQV